MWEPHQCGKRSEVISCLRPLMKLSQRRARAILSEYMKGSKESSDVFRREGICIVFNRMYFDVPASILSKEVPTENSWYGSPDSKFALWPLGFVDNRLSLIGIANGRGPVPYNFEREFDTFQSRFKRRDWSREP